MERGMIDDILPDGVATAEAFCDPADVMLYPDEELPHGVLSAVASADERAAVAGGSALRTRTLSSVRKTAPSRPGCRSRARS
jgi:hypothetical protein